MTEEQNTSSLTTAQVEAINAQTIASIFEKLVTVGPKAADLIKKLGPISAKLPAPWNVLSDPLVQQAADIFPTLLPILQEISEILNGLPQQQ